jgi:hypothetical protein
MQPFMAAHLVIDALLMAILRPASQQQYCIIQIKDRKADSTGRCNTHYFREVAMKPYKRSSERCTRSKLNSPGRPPVWQREQLRGFSQAIASGKASEDAGVSVGVSAPVGARWFRNGEGMLNFSASDTVAFSDIRVMTRLFLVQTTRDKSLRSTVNVLTFSHSVLICQYILNTICLIQEQERSVMMKTKQIQLRVNPAEKDSFELAAKVAGVPLSAWIRERLRKVARRELEDAGQKIPFLQAISEQS